MASKINGGHFLGLGLTFIISFALSTAACGPGYKQEHNLVCNEIVVARAIIIGADNGPRWVYNHGAWFLSEVSDTSTVYTPKSGETCIATYNFIRN